jgi:hypothetical protein
VRNHYVTLGIMQDATPREVVYAYRHLARKLHPDLHPDDPEAAERFRDVHEAYEVLSDPRARQLHDAELTRVGVVPPGGILAPPRGGRRTHGSGPARPANTPRQRRVRRPAPVTPTPPGRAVRPLLRRPWWEPPLYGLLVFAAGSLVAVAAVGWDTYEAVGGALGIVLFLFWGLYALLWLSAGAITRR